MPRTLIEQQKRVPISVKEKAADKRPRTTLVIPQQFNEKSQVVIMTEMTSNPLTAKQATSLLEIPSSSNQATEPLLRRTSLESPESLNSKLNSSSNKSFPVNGVLDWLGNIIFSLNPKYLMMASMSIMQAFLKQYGHKLINLSRESESCWHFWNW